MKNQTGTYSKKYLKISFDGPNWPVSILFCIIFSITMFSGIEAFGSAKTKPETKPLKVSHKIEEFRARLEKLLSPIDYVYSPAGKPDPFQPFLRSKPAPSPSRITQQKKRNRESQKPQQCLNPLACMDVGQLKLVAIVIEDKGENLAMAQDASGIGYVLKKGMPIGYRHGYVKSVLPDRVIIEEETENIRGDTVKVQRVLFLHPEEK